jgi:hypothetical protein
MLTVLRRFLGHRVRVEEALEIALWLAIPYLLVGVIWAFLHPLDVQRIESMLLTLLPAGTNIIAFGLIIGLWPIMVIAPLLC